MAHLLAYYKELTQPDGRIVRLEIYRKQTTSASWVVKEIGPVIQALHLDIQGHSGDIDAPIIKTSLVMTFVDAPDHEEASSKKCGSWEEFYTSDSTYWKVLLLAHDEDEQEFRQIWGGYVTPDSFSEQLRYRGSVTIVARDNIGHMQDFPFDAQGNEDGMITLQELVNAAWAKIESPMTLDWRGEEDSAEWLESEGVAAPFTSMNVSAFKEMNWYDAVEKALYSYGIVMRYIGNNRVQMASLRYMPYHGRASIDSVEHIAPIFVAAAERELAPAARRIEETVDYKIGSGKQVPLSVDFSGTSGTCPFLSTNIFGETTTFNIPVWPVSNTGDTGWGNVPSSTLFFNPKKYTIADAEARDNAERMLYLAANTDGSRYVWYGTYLRAKNFSFNLKFGDAIERSTATTVTTAHKVGDEGIGRVRVSSLKCAITVKQQGITKFYNGSDWSVDYAEIDVAVENQAANIDVYMSAYTGEVLVRFFIIDVKLIYSWDHSRGLGYYAPISDFRIEMSGSQPLLETNRINTVYKDDNNVVISRSPDFGPAYNDVIFPEVIRNGIYAHVGDAYLPAKTWEWEFYAGASQHLAVYTHLQLLCYYAKPNNIITGTIINADATRPFAIYTYNGSEHLLISGSVNYLTGMIDGAVIREFTRYSDLWDGATFPPYEENGSTNIEGGSSSGGSSGGGSSGGGGSVTVDTEMSDTSENAVQNKVIKAYVDAVKAELDAIVGGDATDAIESINEILAFLSTMADTDTLAGIVANLKKMIQEGDDGNIRYTDDAIAALKLYLDNADNDLDEKIGNLAERVDDLESSKAVIFDATSSTDPWNLNVLQTSTTIEEMTKAINNGSPIYMRFGSGLVAVANAELYQNGDVSLYVHLVDSESELIRTIHTYSTDGGWAWESTDNPMGGDESDNFLFSYDSTTNKATAEMVAGLASAITANKLIVCNGRVYKFILEDGGMYGLVSDAYMDITDGKLKTSILAVTASTYDVQLMEQEVPVGTEITEETVRGWGFTKNAGTITGIKMNGATKGTSGVVDLGNVLTEHQKLKTINNQSIVGEGNIEIQGGGATPRVEMTASSAVLQPNTFHVWPIVDALDLTLGAEQSGVMNRYLFQFRNPKAGLTLLTLPDDITWSEDTELDENGMPVMEATAFYRIEIIEGLASLKKWKLSYIQFADAEVERVLMANGIGDGIGITKKDAAAVTQIGSYFMNNTTIESFNEFAFFSGIVGGVGNSTIYNQAFKGCTALREISMPVNATEIYDANVTTNGMFNGCTALAKVNMENIVKIGAYAFYGCTSLAEVAIDWSKVIKIGAFAFRGCTSLVVDEMNLESLEIFGRLALSGVRVKMLNLGKTTVLPSVALVEDDTYGAKSVLERVIIPEGVTSIPSYSFAQYEVLKTINFPDSLASIEVQVFYYCTSLEGDVVVNNVTTIGNSAFNHATKITALIAPSIISIGMYAFDACAGMTRIILGEDVASIGNGAFRNCTALLSVIVRNITPPTLGVMAFNGSTCPIYVPDASVEAYKAATNWNTYASRIKGITELATDNPTLYAEIQQYL